MKKKAVLNLGISMLIFGTVGIFKVNIPLPSGLIAAARGALGVITILLFMLLAKKKIDKSEIKKNILPLSISGGFIGINWILLFEAYSYTSVATATLAYYMAPIFVIVAATLIFRERCGLKKGLCCLFAVIGMVFVSGLFSGDAMANIVGILFGAGAAVFYAAVTLINRKISGISAYTKTIVQLFFAFIVILPYTLIAERVEAAPSVEAILLLLLLGVLHTGVAYVLYFSSVGELDAPTVSVFAYIDPIVAIILSAVLLSEPMDIFEIIGAVLIIFSTMIAAFPERENCENHKEK